MELFGTKLVKEKPDELGFYCIACDDLHFARVFTVQFGAAWNRDKPNFNVLALTPGLKASGHGFHTDLAFPGCSFNITEGIVTYHANCEHNYAGESLPVPEVPEHIISAYEIQPESETSCF